jgi:hypothetical protein
MLQDLPEYLKALAALLLMLVTVGGVFWAVSGK